MDRRPPHDGGGLSHGSEVSRSKGKGMRYLVKHYSEILGIACLLIPGFIEWKNGYFKGAGRKFAVRQLRPAAIAAFGICLVLVFAFDQPIRDFVHSMNQGVVHVFILLGAFLGYHMNIIIAVSVLYAAGAALRSRELRYLAFGTMLSSTVTALSSSVFKILFMRARPYKDLGPYCFFQLDGLVRLKKQYQSLPSGDVAIVAGAVSFVFFSTKHPARYLLFLLPLFTAMSRIQLNMHWPSDTLAAFGLSLLFGCLLAEALARPELTARI